MTTAEMLAAPWTYLAILKGRSAEYAALRELKPAIRRLVMPLIALWNRPDGEATVKELAQALRDLTLSFDPQGPLAIDGGWLSDLGVFRRAIEAARARGWVTIPSMRLTDADPYVDIVREASPTAGALIRVTRADFTEGSVADLLGARLERLELEPDQVDLVLDLRSIEWEHLGADAMAVAGMLAMLPTPDRWRHLAVASSSLPPDFRGFARHEVTHIPRSEAWLYESLADRSLPRMPVFADYVVAYPDPVEEKAVQAGYSPQTSLIRYSTPDEWLIARGEDINRAGSAHIPPLLRKLMDDPEYRSPAYSAGDRWIAEAANGKTGTGNATRWRRAASSHHMTLVTQQLATRIAP
jgi:hypothetical protein